MAAQNIRSWRQLAVRVMVEPPFVPRMLWPRTIVEAALDGMAAAVDTVLNRIDLTQLVIDRLSVSRIVDSLDIEALLAQMNVSGIVTGIVDDIDLPNVIRDSTGAMASDSVVGMRLQSASADDIIDRWAKHLTPSRRRPVAPAKSQ